ncbi:putative sugar transporter [Halenospora varia]|nr:putative sugar transporter [Halenospora varia]
MTANPTPRSLFENLSANFKNGLIDSPLRNLNDATLERDIEAFHTLDNLNDVLDLTLLKRGGSMARNPNDENGDSCIDASFLTEEEQAFTDIESAALRRESAGTIKGLTKDLFIVFATCAMGAVVQGWGQESIVGANLYWPLDLGIATKSEDGRFVGTSDNSLMYFGLVNAMPYFAASVLGAWVSDPITDIWGRRSALLFAGGFSIVGPIGAYYCNSWYSLLICRFIQGIGMGAKSSVVPILESEVSPPKLRGRLLVSWQTFVAMGIFLGACANCTFHGQWRLQIGSAFIPAVPLLCLCYVIPESPRWLMKKGKYRKAYLSLKRLRETPLQAARDLYLIYSQLKVETLLFENNLTGERPGNLFGGDENQNQNQNKNGVQNGAQNNTQNDSENGDQNSTQNGDRTGNKNGDKTKQRRDFWRRVRQLFTIPRNFRAVVASCVAMSSQQFSGFNVFAFLATSILVNSGIGEMTNLEITLGLALTNVIFSATAYILVDRLGRRTLLISSLALMFPFLLLCGHYLDVEGVTWRTLVPLLVVYTAIYSPGAGAIPFMYSSEVFPLVHREAGMSLACAVNFGLAGLLALLTPLYSTSLINNNLKLLGAFAGLDASAAIMVWLFMRSPPEAMSLEEMNVRLPFFLPSPMSNLIPCIFADESPRYSLSIFSARPL